jgi:hypothetical protein
VMRNLSCRVTDALVERDRAEPDHAPFVELLLQTRDMTT